MFEKLCSIYFASFGFALVTIISIIRGAQLLASFQRGFIALILFLIIGRILGAFFLNIVTADETDNKN
ncbi:MAG: hypothetical protein DRP78_01700 [Candidatus Omnitrophota bacterium]|nr:MAG: hypothetical protein DRP78_01700 [Candidatus Omnitrophota bacterium]